MNSFDINRKSFGSYVKKCRKKRKMTQQQLADEIGVQAKTISYIERGENYPSQENIFKIAVVLNMSLDEYLYGYKNESETISISEINEMLSKLSRNKKVFILTTLKTMCENLKII